MFLSNALISVIFFISMLLLKKPLSLKVLFSKSHAKKILSVSILHGSATFIQMLALKFTLVLYVITLKRASGIFSVLLGWIFLKEKHILQKLIAASVMLI